MSDKYADLRERVIVAQERINELKMKLSIARDGVDVLPVEHACNEQCDGDMHYLVGDDHA